LLFYKTHGRNAVAIARSKYWGELPMKRLPGAGGSGPPRCRMGGEGKMNKATPCVALIISGSGTE
jgi:hypothetical protein